MLWHKRMEVARSGLWCFTARAGKLRYICMSSRDVSWQELVMMEAHCEVYCGEYLSSHTDINFFYLL